MRKSTKTGKFQVTESDKMKISIVTWDLNFRDSFHSIYSLHKIFKAAGISHEFIVSGSSKSSTDEFSDLPVTFVSVPQHIYHPGKLLNAAIQHVSGDHILICDADLIFPLEIVSFIKSVDWETKFGLIHRIDLKKYKEQYWITDDYDKAVNHAREYVIKTKINNYAPMIFASLENYNRTGGFDDTPIFATMVTKFCKDVYMKLGRAHVECVVCPVPALHCWHPTPKNQLTKLQKLQFGLRLAIQEFLLRIPSERLRYIFGVILNISLYPWINRFNLTWRQP